MDEEDYHDVMDAEETGKREEEGEKIARVGGAQHSAEEEDRYPRHHHRAPLRHYQATSRAVPTLSRMG